MDNIDNKYIEDAIEELVKIVGIRENYKFKPFEKLIKSKKPEEAIQLVATYLRLPIKIQLSYVSDKYDPNEESQFKSYHLTKTDHAGRGIGGITAQVYIPSYLPPFGSRGLDNYPIKVKISKDASKHPETFIAVISHELSHILLNSIGYIHKENEVHTDLTPMLLGFSKIIREGRMTTEEKTEFKHNFLSTEKITHINTTTYGYLTDEQFVCALNIIERLQKEGLSLKKKVLKEKKAYKKLVLSYQRQVNVLKKFLEHVDSHLNQKFDKHHGDILMKLHQQMYKDAIDSELLKGLQKVERFDQKVDETPNAIIFYSTLEAVSKEIKDAKSILLPEIKKLKNDLNILKRYVSTFYRFKVYFAKQ